MSESCIRDSVPVEVHDGPTDKQVMCFGCMERARKLLESREETEVQRLANVELVKKLDASMARELELTKELAAFHNESAARLHQLKQQMTVIKTELRTLLGRHFLEGG